MMQSFLPLLLLLPISIFLLFLTPYFYTSSGSSESRASAETSRELLTAGAGDPPFPPLTRERKGLGGHHRIFHTFWVGNPEQPLNEKVLTAYRSVLRTQFNVRFIIWTLHRSKEVTERQVSSLKDFCPDAIVEVRTLAELLAAVKLEVNDLKLCAASLDSPFDTPETFPIAGVSDLLRFLALYYYGGIYIDSDVLMVKSMSSFFNKDFAFRWDDSVEHYNTCVMGLRRHSPIPLKIIQHYKSCELKVFHPEAIHHALDCPNKICAEFTMYPTLFFDPMQTEPVNSVEKKTWQWEAPQGAEEDRFGWIFTADRMSSVDAFFPGIYAFHWHNRWETPINSNSMFAEFQRINAKCVA